MGKIGCNDEHMSNTRYVDNLKFIRKDNLNKLIIAHLNINSIRSKFDFLVDKIKGNVDIMMISETNLDNTFPNGQFLTDGFNESIRLDWNKKVGGILLFIREDTPIKVLSFETSPIKGFFIEINLYKKKWLLCCSYNHLSALRVSLNIYSSQYKHFAVVGDFNEEAENRDMEEFCKNYNLKSLIRVPTCYKTPKKLSCINLIQTNSQRSFQSSRAIETGLSDFHRMTVTVMKASFRKLKPKVIHYRNYKRFCNESYRNELHCTKTEEILNGKLHFLCSASGRVLKTKF